MARRASQGNSWALLAIFPAVLVVFWPLAVFHGAEAAVAEVVWLVVLVAVVALLVGFAKTYGGRSPRA